MSKYHTRKRLKQTQKGSEVILVLSGEPQFNSKTENLKQ